MYDFEEYKTFETAIVKKHLQLNNEKIVKFCYENKEKNSGRIVSNRGGWQSQDFEMKEEIPELFYHSEKIVKHLASVYGLNENCNFKMGNSWININSSNDTNVVHNHPNSVFSIVYYPKFPENSGNIVFLNPNQSSIMFFPFNNIKTYNSVNIMQLNVKPSEGLLICFPSWINHYVENGTNTEDRISISSNFTF